MIIQKYEYPKLKRIQKDGSRKYTDGTSIPVASVTTILSDTADKTHLIEWRKRVGEAEAQRITTEAAGFGTMVHNALEKYLLEQDYAITGNNLVHTMARRAFDVMVDKGLTQCDEIWGSEVGLIAQGLYAGTSDAVGMFNGMPSIIDFKTAKKIKPKKWITDYFLQGCAYALAHNEMFGSDIRQVAIMMVDRQGEYEDFVIEGAEFDQYANMWADRVTQYYSKK